jgi:hypothetical protein
MPSSSISVLCIGAYSQKSFTPTSIAPADSPSPVTRFQTSSKGIYNCRKPELVEHGGNLNHNLNFTGVGVSTVSSSGNREERLGTSFSTPIVAGHLAEVVQKYGQFIHNAETLKALLVSSCVPTLNHPAYCGFGKPRPREMLYSSYQTAKIVFENEMPLTRSDFKVRDPAWKFQFMFRQMLIKSNWL